PGEDAAAGGGDPKEHSALPDGDGYGGPGRTGSGRAEEAAPARADCRPDQVLTQLQMRARNNFRGPARTRFAIENKAAVNERRVFQSVYTITVKRAAAVPVPSAYKILPAELF